MRPASIHNIALFLFSLLLSLAVGLGQAEDAKTPSFQSAKKAGNLQNPLLHETSGLAVSQRNNAVLWAVNDSGNDPLVFALTCEGKDLGAVRISGVANLDWEDLASFQYQGKPYLLVADTGDNRQIRDLSYLHIIEEPRVDVQINTLSSLVKRTWTVAFRFEHGSQDCEAVAVLPDRGQILLITKRESPAGVYTLPLVPEEGDIIQTARKVATLDHIPAPRGIQPASHYDLRFAEQPTAVTVAPDSSAIAVLTYVAVYYWQVAPKQSLKEIFSVPPERIALPHLHQVEGICFSNNGDRLFLVSEDPHAPLMQLRRRN